MDGSNVPAANGASVTGTESALGVPGVVYVGPSSSESAHGLHLVQTGPAVGWMNPKGIQKWEREISVVARGAVTEDIRKALGVTLPQEQVAAAKLPWTSRAAETSPLLAVASTLVEKLVQKGVRVHTVGFDRMSGGFYYFADGGERPAMRIQGDLFEMIGPALQGKSETADIDRLLDGLLDRLLTQLSGGELSEAALELAAALPRVATDGSGTADCDLEAFEKEAAALARHAEGFGPRAEELAAALRENGGALPTSLQVPLFGEAKREEQAALEVEASAERIALPARSRWFVSGVITEAAKPAEKAPAEKVAAKVAEPVAAKAVEVAPAKVAEPVAAKAVEVAPAKVAAKAPEPAAKPVEKAAEKPVEKAAEKPAETAAAKSVPADKETTDAPPAKGKAAKAAAKAAKANAAANAANKALLPAAGTDKASPPAAGADKASPPAAGADKASPQASASGPKSTREVPRPEKSPSTPSPAGNAPEKSAPEKKVEPAAAGASPTPAAKKAEAEPKVEKAAAKSEPKTDKAEKAAPRSEKAAAKSEKAAAKSDAKTDKSAKPEKSAAKSAKADEEANWDVKTGKVERHKDRSGGPQDRSSRDKPSSEIAPAPAGGSTRVIVMVVVAVGIAVLVYLLLRP